MKKIFSQKGNLMTKFLINQIALSLFGLMVAGFGIKNDGWMLAMGVFAILFYYFILITFIREDGLKDALKVEGGRMKKDPLLSLKYCGLAAVPGFVVVFINIVASLITKFASLSSPVLDSISGVANIITRVLTYGMYNPLNVYLFDSTSGVLKGASWLSECGITFAVYTLFTLVVCFLAYNSGLNQMFVKENPKQRQ